MADRRLSSPADLDDLRERTLASLANRRQKSVTLAVGMGTCGRAAGASETLQAILGEINALGLSDVKVIQTGCLGLCAWEPIVQVWPGEGEQMVYSLVTPERARHIVQEHVILGRPIRRWAIPQAKAQPEGLREPSDVDLTLVDDVLAQHGRKPDALVAILTQLNQTWGYLPCKGLVELAKKMGLPAHRVFGSASFYSMLNLTPLGEHVIRFCQDAPCHVAGGREVWEALQEVTGLRFGQTSADGRWTLLTTSCLGLCGVGPVLLVDDEIYGNVTPERVPQILAGHGR